MRAHTGALLLRSLRVAAAHSPNPARAAGAAFPRASVAGDTSVEATHDELPAAFGPVGARKDLRADQWRRETDSGVCGCTRRQQTLAQASNRRMDGEWTSERRRDGLCARPDGSTTRSGGVLEVLWEEPIGCCARCARNLCSTTQKHVAGRGRWCVRAGGKGEGGLCAMRRLSGGDSRLVRILERLNLLQDECAVLPLAQLLALERRVEELHSDDRKDARIEVWLRAARTPPSCLARQAAHTAVRVCASAVPARVRLRPSLGLALLSVPLRCIRVRACVCTCRRARCGCARPRADHSLAAATCSDRGSSLGSCSSSRYGCSSACAAHGRPLARGPPGDSCARARMA